MTGLLDYLYTECEEIKMLFDESSIQSALQSFQASIIELETKVQSKLQIQAEKSQNNDNDNEMAYLRREISDLRNELTASRAINQKVQKKLKMTLAKIDSLLLENES